MLRLLSEQEAATAPAEQVAEQAAEAALGGVLNSGGMQAVVRLEDGRVCDVKRRRSAAPEPGLFFRREVEALKCLQGQPNVAYLVDFVISTPEDGRKFVDYVFAAVETTVALELSRAERQQRCLRRRDVQGWTRDVLTGLAHIHAKGFLHRNVTPENLLLERRGPAKYAVRIAGFSLARKMEPDQVGLPGQPGTPYTVMPSKAWYAAPEMLMQWAHYGRRSDLWAVACTLYKMLTSQDLFPGESEVQVLYRQFALLGTPDETNWPGGRAALGQHFDENWPQYPGGTTRVAGILSALRTQARGALPGLRDDPAARLLPRAHFGHANLLSESVELLAELLAYEPKRAARASKLLTHRFFNDTADWDFKAGVLTVFASGHARTTPEVRLNVMDLARKRAHQDGRVSSRVNLALRD